MYVQYEASNPNTQVRRAPDGLKDGRTDGLSDDNTLRTLRAEGNKKGFIPLIYSGYVMMIIIEVVHCIKRTTSTKSQ